MFVTVLACLTGVALVTGVLLETCIRLSRRRDALKAANAQLTPLTEPERSGHTALASGNAELFDLAGYRAVRASRGVRTEPVAEHDGVVVHIDFRRQAAQPMRLRARA